MNDVILQHAMSDLDLHSLPMSHKKDSMLLWVKETDTILLPIIHYKNTVA